MMLIISIKYYIAYLFYFSNNAASFTKIRVEGRVVLAVVSEAQLVLCFIQIIQDTPKRVPSEEQAWKLSLL